MGRISGLVYLRSLFANLQSSVKLVGMSGLTLPSRRYRFYLIKFGVCQSCLVAVICDHVAKFTGFMRLLNWLCGYRYLLVYDVTSETIDLYVCAALQLIEFVELCFVFI